MAAKHRRTKGKDWSESSSDDASDDNDSHIQSRLDKISFVKLEQERKLKKTNKRLSKLCDSDENSDIEKKKRPSLPIARKLPISIYTETDSSSSEKSHSPKKTAKEKSLKKKLSESDSDEKNVSNKKRKVTSKEKDSNKSKKDTSLRNYKENKSDSSSSKEFQKPKDQKSRTSNSKYSIGEHIMDDYTIIITPSKSDADKIPVEPNQEKLLKRYITEEIDKIQGIYEELKSDLEIQGNYLIKKKVNVLRDSQFIAHKILRLYDGTFQKIKEVRNNFTDVYKTWLDTCSSSNSKSAKPKTPKKRYHLYSDDDNSEEDERTKDTSLKEKSNRKEKKSSTKSSSKSNESISLNSDQEDECIQRKDSSSKKKINQHHENKSPKSSGKDEESDDTKETNEDKNTLKEDCSIKKKVDKEKRHSSNISSKSLKEIDIPNTSQDIEDNEDNEDAPEESSKSKNKEEENNSSSSKFEEYEEFNNVDDSDKNEETQEENSKSKEKISCPEEKSNNLSPKADEKNKSDCMDLDEDSEDAQNENFKSKEKIDNQEQRNGSSSSKSSNKDKSIVHTNESSQKENVRLKEKTNVKKKNLSLTKKFNSTSNEALSDSEKSDKLNLERKDDSSVEMSDKSSKKKRRKSAAKESNNELTSNLSDAESNNNGDQPAKKDDEIDSTGQVSDCDSAEIFSEDETRSKKKDDKSAPTEDHSETAKIASDSEDLFDSTASEIQNTPVKSPILSTGNKSLRKTILASKQKYQDESVAKDEKQVNVDEEEKSQLAITSSLETTTKKSRLSSSEEEKFSSPEKVENASSDEAKAANSDAEDDSETEAKKKLLRDCDSDSLDADSEKSVDSSCSTIVLSKRRSNRKSLDASKKTKKLSLQTKKRDSLYSVSSSDSNDDEADRPWGKKHRKSGEGLLAARKHRRLPAFNVRKNRHYKADKKLRMVCRVTLERLASSLLVKYKRALEKSEKYVANKKFHSITNLDALETPKKSKKALEAIEEFSEGDVTPKTKSKKKSKSEKKSIKDHSYNEIIVAENDISDEDVAMDKTNGKETTLSDEGNIELAIAEETENDAKEALLISCSSSSNEEDNVMEVDANESEENKNSKKSKKENKKNSKKEDSTGELSDGKSEDEKSKKKKEKSKWKEDTLLTYHITDTESEEEKFAKSQAKKTAKMAKEEENDKSADEEKSLKITIKKTRKPRKKRRVLDSESDVKLSSNEDSNASEKPSESEEEKEEIKKKTRKRRKKSSDSDDTSSSEKKQKSKRKRIKKVASESDSDDQESPGKGRKNIRKVLKDRHVAEDTKRAAQDEEDRLKRIAERQKLFNEMYDARLAGETKVDKLVLDVDEETKEELVDVHKELVKRLKPHQAKGIKFMWDACFESLKQIEKSEGSGCIIAHCMGLGKTFQVVTLAHTLLSHEETGVNTVMIVCPLSTVLNWVNEFKTWLKHVKDGDEIEIYELTKMKKNIERKYQLESWQKTGGVLIIGYEMFRNLTSTGKKMRKAMQESIMRSLVDPGADLVVCDEGHLLKNEESALSKAMKLVKTRRRIVLTGTPLQNNLKEYHCMVQFVKPNLLGTKKEFLNRFVNPITNGQFDDSTPNDVKLMKKRAHVLHKMLEGSVQRFDYSVLTPFLPPKQEYVIFVRLTEVQIKMYQHYLDNFARRFGGRNGSLFADFQELQRIWTHPYVLRLNAAKIDKANEKKRLEASDSEGSLREFIDDDSESDSNSISSSHSGSNSDVQCVDSDAEKPAVKTRSTRLNPKDEPEEIVPVPQETTEESAWWSKFVEEEHFEDLRISTKLVLLFGILKESEQIGDKVLVFSQSLYSLTLIEQFLNLIDQETINGVEAEHLENHTGTWSLGLDYFRLDGSTSAENRSAWCKIFNTPSNTRARLFLISTRAGGLGINLTAANRVIIFDASWNPSHDVQSIFRIYRFGQKKPCYVYRFLAAGTMEEKIYNRQVTKLSLACRVVDEQQIERHYSNNDLAELYQFESYEGKSIMLNLPKDRMLAEIFLKYKDVVYNYHEHDSLLENKEEEELDEEERKQAWLEYEEEKQGKRQMVNMGNNMMNNLAFNQMLMNMNSFPELESIKLLIQKDYPNLPPEHLEQVARQAVFDMYRFVDQQAVNQLINPYAGQAMQPSNMLGAPGMQQMQQQQFNQQSQLVNMLTQPQINYPGVNQMPVYSGRGRPPKHLSMNNPVGNMRTMQTPMQPQMQSPMQVPMQTSMQLPQQAQMQSNRSSDEVQVITDQQVPQPNNISASNTNNVPEE